MGECPCVERWPSDGSCKECGATATEKALRAQNARLTAALREIADKECTGIASPPGCACRTCVARRALKGEE